MSIASIQNSSPKVGPAADACPSPHLTLLTQVKEYNEISSYTAYYEVF